MTQSIRRRLSYANVVATLALFMALGGASYAAVTLPRNSVGPAQIKSNAVTGAKVKNSTLTGSDVKDGSLTTKDFGSTLPAGPQGAAGAQGAPGAPGAKGDKGDPGDPKRSFARIAYTAGVPAITAQSGGLAVVNEPFLGAVRISFPQSMDACAVTATSFTGGATTSIRRSTVGAGTEIVVIGFDDAGTTVETDFDLITQC